MSYLTNTAASVRNMGQTKSGELAKKFGAAWITEEFMPIVINHYNVDKKGYNYRICCLNSMAEMMPYVGKDVITSQIIPLFIKGSKDDIPNVKFCVSKCIILYKSYIDTQVFNNQL